MKNKSNDDQIKKVRALYELYELYELHDADNFCSMDLGLQRPMTKRGIGILDDIEFQLFELGSVAEDYYIEALHVFASKLLGKHLTKAND